MKIVFIVLLCSLYYIQAKSVQNVEERQNFAEKFNPKAIVPIGNNTYYFSPAGIKTNGLEAMLFCNDVGMALASFETVDEWFTVREYVNNNYENAVKFWVSGVEFMDTWIWSGTGTVATSAQWEPNYPYSSAFDDNCMYVQPGFNIKNERCFIPPPAENPPFGFICENKCK